MSTEFVRNMLIEQRKRVTASIMGFAEQNLYSQMSVGQQRAFREKVMSSVGNYHDTCLDMLKASVDDGYVVNTEALRMLRDIHAEVTDA